VAVDDSEEGYPEKAEYDESSREIVLGKGRFGPVSSEVWTYEVSGFRVVQSWLAYRMKGGAGRSSSPLDEIRETTWPASFTKELLELLWVIEHTVATHPRQAALLDEVLAGPLFVASDLPEPTDAERKPPEPTKKIPNPTML